MAYVTDTTASGTATLNAAVSSLTSSIATFFADLAKTASRANALEELQAMDDATLKAKHGITRSQIVSYVFQDKLA